ncbi:hypothetical protein ACVNIS_06555 [Sphaerotilaceae bacterium SBD11-9]
MTTQIPDTIFFNGDEHFVFDEPLSSRTGLPNFMAASTANHRGYVAVWAVVGSRLYIVSLSGCVPDDSRNGLELVFPSAQAPVLADWYSGELRLLSGRVIKQSEIDPIYEREAVLKVESGCIRSHHSFSREYAPAQHFDPMLFLTVSSLDELDPKLLGQLTAANIHTVGDLIKLGELELAKAAGLTVDAALDVKEALACRGFVLGTRLPGWPPKSGIRHSV